jgi:four helix bundle protein
MKSFRDLVVWQKAHQLVLETYASTKSFPVEERFGLTSQIRRSSSSIPSNIAEGCGRRGNSEFHRFLQVAMGSASELEYQLLLAHDLKYVASTEYEPLNECLIEVKRMLASLISKVDEERHRSRGAGA